MILLHIIVLALTAALAWPLSRFDNKITGEDNRKDLSRRSLRCVITLALVELALGNLVRWVKYSDSFSGYTFLVLGVPLAGLWCGCLTEMFAEWFHLLMDPQDHREADLQKGRRDLDQLAGLVQAGRREEAIDLCKQLKASGDASALAMETMLEHLEAAMKEASSATSTTGTKSPVKQGLHSNTEGDFKTTQLQDLEDQTTDLSVDELLEKGYLGTAIEILEQKAKAQPNDFEIWIKLAEAYGRFCKNLSHAGKIVARIEANPAFSSEQVQMARTRMQKWHE